jgi:hypothetical protein
MMGDRTVTAADGVEWKVGRRWLPPATRVRIVWPRLWTPRGPLETGDPVILGFAVVFGFGAIIVALVALFLALQILVVAGAMLLGLAGHELFHRPWIIEARPPAASSEAHCWEVRGWHGSAQAIGRIADALAWGEAPELVTGAVRVEGRVGEWL